MTSKIQKGTEEIVNSGAYDTSDDFTVVLQHFMKNMRPPKKVINFVLNSFIRFASINNLILKRLMALQISPSLLQIASTSALRVMLPLLLNYGTAW
jgi:hypothetical protein